jgi:hypothetical protein
MFSLFKKERHKRIDDRIYVSRTVADNSFIAEYHRLISEKSEVFLFCFFDKSIARLQPLMQNNTTLILNAEKLKNDFANVTLRSNIQQKHQPIFLFAEHHPHLYLQEAIIKEIETLCIGNNPAIGFFTSLDEPLMQHFGSQNIIELIKKMELKEDEVISHSIVTKSVENAQRKIAKKVPYEIRAKSQEEWVIMNLSVHLK